MAEEATDRTGIVDDVTLLEDGENWRHYLEPGERLLGTWKPDDGLRVYGQGKTLLVGSASFALAYLVLFGHSGTSFAGTFGVALALLAFGLVLGLGPALIDRTGRRGRRFALTSTRALEFQDIRHGRLRAVRLGPTTRTLKLYNADMESYEVSFVNVDDEGRAGRSVLFERLSEAQADQVLNVLPRTELAKGREGAIVTPLARPPSRRQRRARIAALERRQK